MHDHCTCGAVLRERTIHMDGFNGWCCNNCGTQLSYGQVALLVPPPPPRRRWWRR